MRDLQITSLEEILAKKKEEFEDEIKEKNSMIRHLEEDLGVWESIEPQLTATNELLDAREKESEMTSKEAEEGTISVAKCQECNFSTGNATKMKGHMVRHRKYRCDECEEVLKDQAHLTSHVQRLHKPDSNICNKCNKQFKSKNSLKQHMNAQHMETHQVVNPPIGHPQWANSRNETRSLQLDYTCNMCENAFETLKDIREHKSKHHQGQNFEGFEVVAKTCRFFQQGRCNRVRCSFAHILPSQQQQQQSSACEVIIAGFWRGVRATITTRGGRAAATTETSAETGVAAETTAAKTAAAETAAVEGPENVSFPGEMLEPELHLPA